MLSMYVVSCVCGAATGCDPPDDPDFVEAIQCIVCGRKLNAKNGHWHNRPIVIKEPEGIDLLAVC